MSIRLLQTTFGLMRKAIARRIDWLSE